jgi:Lrp/AsnC family transcriptional regulator, regulator for asnA, asnC and gidA
LIFRYLTIFNVDFSILFIDAPLYKMYNVSKIRGKMAKSHRVDDTDLAIIRILQRDGRRAYADIASELRLAPSTVQQRANRLIEAGLLKITALVDPRIVDISVFAMIAIKVDGTRLREAAVDIGRFEETDYVVICTGPYDILIEVACRSNDDLLSFISDKLAKVQGVREIETFLYLRTVKDSDQWSIPEQAGEK